jgi:hypothetical protein
MESTTYGARIRQYVSRYLCKSGVKAAVIHPGLYDRELLSLDHPHDGTADENLSAEPFQNQAF